MGDEMMNLIRGLRAAVKAGRTAYADASDDSVPRTLWFMAVQKDFPRYELVPDGNGALNLVNNGTPKAQVWYDEGPKFGVYRSGSQFLMTVNGTQMSAGEFLLFTQLEYTASEYRKSRGDV